jgi:protein TonB
VKQFLALLLSVLFVGCTSVSPQNTSNDASKNAGSPENGLSPDDGTTVLPKAIHMEIPEYPEYLKRQGISGIVMVYFEVGIDGRVTDAFAAEFPHPDLAKAAVAAIMNSKFEPARVDGVPTVFQMSVPVRFDPD